LSEQRRNFYAEEIVGALVISITGKYLVNVPRGGRIIKVFVKKIFVQFQLSLRVLSVLAGGPRDKFQPTIRTRDG